MSSTSVFPALRWPHKDPDEKLDYKINWVGTSYRPGPLFGTADIIEDSLWVMPAGISKENEAHDDTTTTIWLSGGTEGESYAILNRITSRDGRVCDQTVLLAVRTK